MRANAVWMALPEDIVLQTCQRQYYWFLVNDKLVIAIGIGVCYMTVTASTCKTFSACAPCVQAMRRDRVKKDRGRERMAQDFKNIKKTISCKFLLPESLWWVRLQQAEAIDKSTQRTKYLPIDAISCMVGE